MHRILLHDQQLTKGKEALFEIAVRMNKLQNCKEQEELGHTDKYDPIRLFVFFD